MEIKFTGTQRLFEYTQINHGTIEEIFPLLCPVCEKDWIDGWEYTMIHSKSGYAEKNSVFTTPHHGQFDTVWHITQHDVINHHVEFLRITPLDSTVKINIQLEKIGEKRTKAIISYLYTGLSPKGNEIIEKELQQSFNDSMVFWEKAINHYLTTGNKLLK